MSDSQWDQVRLNVLNRRNEANRDELNAVSFLDSPIYAVQLIADRKEIREEMTAIHNRQIARGEHFLIA
jgi:hypothetical protein